MTALTHTQYITQLYRQWLGREPDAAGLSFFVQQLDGGYLTRAQAAATLYESGEFAQGALRPLMLLYQAAFGRLPDEVGLTFWRGVYHEGGSWAQIAQQFVQSPEFLGRYGGQVSDSDFVNLLYQNVLSRAPDLGGHNYWLAKLQNGMTRGDLLQGFAQSPENMAQYAGLTQTVAAYWGMQGRLPTSAEITAAPADRMALFVQVVAGAQLQPTAPGGPSLSLSTTVLNESPDNDGSIAQTVDVRLMGDAFTKVGSVVKLSPPGLPAGLSAVLHVMDAQHAVLELTGAARAHATSLKTIQLPLAADLLQSGNPGALQGLKQPITLKFSDVFAHEQHGTLRFEGSSTSALQIDLPQSKVTASGQVLDLHAGRMQNVMTVDVTGLDVAKSKGGIAFVGDSDANLFLGTSVMSTVRGGGGDDILQAGAASHRFVFEKTPQDNGRDLIHGFKLGKGGDVLDFSAFLNRTGTSKVATLLSSQSTERAVSNGDVFVVAGAIDHAQEVADLFGVGRPLAQPTQAGKYVVVTADITGDATVWGIINQQDINGVDVSEITPMATLVGVHNLQLVPLTAGNLA